MGTHLFTGFPGFVASQLIRQLFHDGVTKQIYAIVLHSVMEKAKNEVIDIKKEQPHCQIELLEGDITLPNLGIAKAELEMIVPRVQFVWHLAAIYDLAVSRKLAWKVNVHGTTIVNDFVCSLPNLKRYIFFSTAHVGGQRNGRLLETELIRPHTFKNYYEETKFEAELRIEDLKSEVPVTILRPGIVCGHSKTGEIIKFDGIYFFLNMIASLSELPFIPFMGSKATTINVVPIDYICKAASYLCTVREAEGKTFHLTDPKPYKVFDFYSMMVKEMTGKKPVGRIPLSLTKRLLANYSIRKKLGVEYETIEYLAWTAEFDVTQAQAVLHKGGITCPDLLETLPNIVKFYKENKQCSELFIPIK